MMKFKDEKLKMVTGGNLADVLSESFDLCKAGYMSKYYDDALYVTLHWDECSSAVDAGWAAAGVTTVTRFCDADTYFIDGKEVSVRQAYEYAGMPY